MSDRNRLALQELLKKEGNDCCADCMSNENVEWASCSLGIFLCQDCAGSHRSLGVDISRVKSIRLDNWDDEHVKKMADCGNKLINSKNEKYMPKYYKRPTKNDVEVLRSQFIQAKYVRKEFTCQDKQTPYSENVKEGKLMKRGKNDARFKPRQFIINSKDNCIQYFVKEQTKTPKDTLILDDVNIVFVPEKLKRSNGFQITYFKNGVTRNLFLYCDDPKEAVDWFTAIRRAKLERRRLAFPDRDENELCKDLTQDFAIEGYLMKKGPNNEPFRKRWFTLERRKLMYLTDPLASTPKGEIYIGHRDANYSVSMTQNGGMDMCEFVLETPNRNYELKAESSEERDKWITALQDVINTSPTPQDQKMYTAMASRR